MHLLYCVIAGMIVLSIGTFILVLTSKGEVPEKEENKTPVIDIDEDITRSIRYSWRARKEVNN